MSISDSVSHAVSGSEAVPVAPEGLSNDLNMEDLGNPFLLMLPYRKVKLSHNQVCLSCSSLQLVLVSSCE